MSVDTFGTAFDIINVRLSELACYQRFRQGKSLPSYYLSELLSIQSSSYIDGLNEDQLNLSSRFPYNGEEMVDRVLSNLNQKNLIKSTKYPKDEFESFAVEVANNYDHGENVTYIFPEEARLLFALSHIVRPKTSAFLGCYYGYWAIWALPGIAACSGHTVLADTNSDVVGLAERNIEGFGFSKYADCIVKDVTKPLSNKAPLYDFLVVDAEGPTHGDDPDILDKAIYYPIAKAFAPLLKRDGLMLAHNLLFDNISCGAYFEKKIVRNHQQLQKFNDFANDAFREHLTFSTTEGVGIFLK